MSLPSFALGALIVLMALYLYNKAKRGTVSTPLMGQRIDLNPALYGYPGVSSIGAAYG